jgi:hypothetical protein
MGVAKPDKGSVDTTGWLLRSQVADLLRVSEAAVKKWDEKNLLHPRKETRPLPKCGFRDVWVYDPSEVAQLAARRSRAVPLVSDAGDIAARAFELFGEGVAGRDVVIRLRQLPERVEELREQWLELGGSDLVINSAARAALEQLVGPFDGVAALVSAVQGALSRARDADGSAPDETRAP